PCEFMRFDHVGNEYRIAECIFNVNLYISSTSYFSLGARLLRNSYLVTPDRIVPRYWYSTRWYSWPWECLGHAKRITRLQYGGTATIRHINQSAGVALMTMQLIIGIGVQSQCQGTRLFPGGRSG